MTTLSSFQDLKKIGKELEEKARAAEEERKRAQALKEKQARDAQTFASAMSNMGVGCKSYLDCWVLAVPLEQIGFSSTLFHF